MYSMTTLFRVNVKSKINALCCGVFMLFSTQLVAQDLLFDWVNHYAGEGANTSCGDVYKPKTIATDNAGNVYVTGNFTGLVNFNRNGGNDTLNSITSGLKRFVSKTNENGQLIWVKEFGNMSSWTNIAAIAVDSAHNVYLGGYFIDSFDLDPGPARQMVYTNKPSNSSNRDMVIIKLDSAGNYVWGHHFEGVRSAIYGLTVNNQGDIFATGAFSGSLDVDPSSNDYFLDVPGVFALSLNTNGGFKWAKSWKASEGYGIDIDNSGNVYVAGHFSSRTNFNTGTGAADTLFFTPFGSMDIFVSKFDVNGNFVWAKQMGGKRQDQAFSLVADKENGDVYITGIYPDTADFDPGPNEFIMYAQGSTSTMEVFVVKLNTNGEFSWARQLNGAGSNWGYSIAKGYGKFNGVYSTGVFRGTAEFYQGKDTLLFTNNGGTSEAFLIKLDTAGNFEWSKQLGATVGGSVAVDHKGNAYVAGWFNAAWGADFDPGPDTFRVDKVGTLDGYVLKLRRCEFTDTITASACKVYEFLGESYFESGVYEVANPEGCDIESIYVLNLEIYNLEPLIHVNEKTLGTVSEYESYQWLLDGNIIPGATQRYYEVKENGGYQVVVTENECTDTSEVYTVNNAGLNDQQPGHLITIYPNPTEDYINVVSSMYVNVVINGVDGGAILKGSNQAPISLKALAAGVYFVNIYNEDGQLLKVAKVLKQ